MNRYQVIMPSGDVLAITADTASASEDCMLTFTTGEGNGLQTVAQFLHWYGWNLLGPVEEVKATPVAL